MRNQEIANEFFKGVDISLKSNSVQAINGVLKYERYIIAIRRTGGNLCHDDVWYLLNGDAGRTRNSWATEPSSYSRHQLHDNNPRVAFSSLERAGIDPHTVVIMEFQQDIDQHWYAYNRTWDSKKGAVIHKLTQDELQSILEDLKGKGGIVKVNRYKEDTEYIHKPSEEGEEEEQGKKDDIRSIYWHRISSCLMYCPEKDQVWLAGMDEGSYFLSRLPYFVTTIDEAYKALKPLEVKEAERDGRKVKRQGEWFFIPYDNLMNPVTLKPLKFDTSAKYKDTPIPVVKRGQNLPEKDSRGRNVHHVQGAIYQTDNELFVYGVVKHWRKEARSGSGWQGGGLRKSWEHQDVHLGNTWHKAVLNCSLEDYSSQGRVD